MTHTPGPWAASPDGAELWPTVGDNCYVSIAHLSGPWNGSTYYDGPTALSNARLMAAGPELLAALKYMVENAEAEGWSGLMISDAVAAIAKAEGRSE